jgi:ferredoxin/flavodoxin---NADP+ reductase
MFTGRPFRVAIVGSGPSGIYAAEALIKQSPFPLSIDIFDRLPTPYGLVRYGVAPDHQAIKSVTANMQKVLQNPQVRFWGNVAYGQDLTKADLDQHYDATVLAVGAWGDRALGIAGENLSGSLSATEFVAWYNGHPDYANSPLELDMRAVAVVGMGNVAVDVTRVLAKSAEELRKSDIADHSLAVLARSKVQDIYLLGRRGPAQAKFTTKELRELGELAGADIVVRPEELELDEASREAAKQPSLLKNLEVLQAFAAKPLEGKPRRIHLRFLVSPVEILGQDRVEAIRLEQNYLDSSQNAIGNGKFETLEVGMVLRSVGYKGLALADIPFDTHKGTIPNQEGRVSPGLYTTGWIKRGPSGVIGTNKACASDTIKVLLADAPGLPRALNPDPAAILALLTARGTRFVNLDGWLAIDRLETALGQAQGRPRVKLTSAEHMLEVASGQLSPTHKP